MKITLQTLTTGFFIEVEGSPVKVFNGRHAETNELDTISRIVSSLAWDGGDGRPWIPQTWIYNEDRTNSLGELHIGRVQRALPDSTNLP